MSKHFWGKKFKAGEARCFVCEKAIERPVEFWPGRRLVCENPECYEALVAMPGSVVIKEGEHSCFVSGCNQKIPAGVYDRRTLRRGRLVCSLACFRRAANMRKQYVCEYCHRQFWGNNPGHPRHFCCKKHAALAGSDALKAERCGPFLVILNEYLEGFASSNYRDVHNVRLALSTFFEYLNEKRITDLEDVTPRRVTDYLTWARTHKRKIAALRVSDLSTFFHWMIAEERRKKPNPVIPRIHRVQRNPTSPRPYDSADVARIWALLEKHGSTQAKLAVSIGLECGLRPGEIARLKLQDVDLKKQQIYVGLPTKNGEPRTAFFSEQTNTYLLKWLKERDPDCGHDRLLYGFHKLPFTRNRIHNEIAMAVCKEYPGREPIPDGFVKWSTHRLRHTFATTMANNGASTASLMALGGWRSSKAMAGYTKLDPDTIRRSYTEAMRKSREKSTSTTRSMTMSQYLESRAPQS